MLSFVFLKESFLEPSVNVWGFWGVILLAFCHWK